MKVNLSPTSIRVRISQQESLTLSSGKPVHEVLPLGLDKLHIIIKPETAPSPKIDFTLGHHWFLTLPMGTNEFRQRVEFEDSAIEFIFEVDLYKKRKEQ